MSCPVDTRRGLFSNIVAAGGSTKFRGFTKRLQRDINRLVKARYEANIAAVRTKLYGNVEVHGKQMEVVVNGPKHREIAAWLGGSYVASQVCLSTSMIISFIDLLTECHDHHNHFLFFDDF